MAAAESGREVGTAAADVSEAGRGVEPSTARSASAKTGADDGTGVWGAEDWALARAAAKPVMIAKRKESPDMEGMYIADALVWGK